MLRITGLKIFIILTLLLALSLYFLFRTSFPNVVLSTDLSISLENLKRIWKDDPPPSSLTPEEKEKLKNKLKQENPIPIKYCNNSYFPFLPGSNWSYRITTGEDSDVVTIEVPSPEDGKSYLDGRLSSKEDWTVRTAIQCNDEIISIADFNFLMVSRKDQTVTTPCDNDYSGFTLPKDSFLKRGNVWEENVCLVNNVLKNDGNKGVDIKEELKAKWKVGKREKVYLNTGEFEAVKIDGDLSSRQELLKGAQQVEAELDLWVVEGIGIVKIVYQETSINGNPSDKPAIYQEMESFQIPTEKDFKLKKD